MFDYIIGPKRPVGWVLQFWPVLAMSLGVSLLATFFCKKIAIRFGIVDKPDDLVKTHKEPIAYLGGVGMLVGLAAGVLMGILLLRGSDQFNPITVRLIAILVGGAIACFVGLSDDLFDMKPKQKILGQIFAATVLILGGVVPNFDFIQNIIGWQMPGWAEQTLEILIVIVFVLGATNSLNLLDGLDGLCGGVTAIITVAMFLLAAHLATWDFSDVGDPVRIVICLGLIGGVCGFLPFNRYPAKIFMGDAGSMLLGFNVAVLMILFGEKIPRWWMASIVVFGLPILDTAVALVRRLLNHRPLFVSDRGHIYDQMIDRGIGLKKTVGICYALAGLYAVIGLVMSQMRTRYAAIVYVIVIAVSAVVVWKKRYLKMEGLRGAIRKKE
ncbi:MAG: MraY family glycosyltransferase [Phycisphaerae bacterium]|nr:MraY family glycosyltransferase [Phycisphaerae bacterium]